MMLPVLLGMIVLTILNIVIETLFFLPFVCKVVGFGPAGAKKNKYSDKNHHDLFHIISCLHIDTAPPAPQMVNPDKSYF